MPKVLVAVDGTDAAGHVAAFVNDFFGVLEVEIVALHVGQVSAPWYPAGVTAGSLFAWPYPATPAAGDVSTTARAVREAGEEAIQRSGVERDDTVVETGSPIEVIRRTAVDEGADLVVVGSSHKGLLDRLLSPSVSRELSKDAPVPVLIVH